MFMHRTNVVEAEGLAARDLSLGGFQRAGEAGDAQYFQRGRVVFAFRQVGQKVIGHAQPLRGWARNRRCPCVKTSFFRMGSFSAWCQTAQIVL